MIDSNDKPINLCNNRELREIKKILIEEEQYLNQELRKTPQFVVLKKNTR